MAVERRARQRLDPIACRGKAPGGGRPRQIGDVEGAGFRMVPPEMIRVHRDGTDQAGDAQTNDAPVVPRLAPPPRLPAVHPLAALGVLALDAYAAPRLEQVLLRREELVVGGDRPAAEPLGGEIHEARAPGHTRATASFTRRS